jgi:hypothetical protein
VPEALTDVTVVAPPRPPAAPPGADPEALIEEARRRQRRRRRRAAALALTITATGAIVYLLAGRGTSHHPPTAGGTHPGSSAASRPTLALHLHGFGTALPTAIDSGPCPQGRTLIPITTAAGKRIGTAHVCVLTIEKTDLPKYGVRRIVQTVLETDSLPDGRIVSRQTQTIYAHAAGTVSGGGPGVNGVADWQMTINIR